MIENNKETPWWLWRIATLVAAALIIWAFFRFAAVPFVDDVPAAATKVIGSLLIVTAIIERSLAAINNAIFGANKALYERGFVPVADRALVQDGDAAAARLAVIRGKEQQIRLMLGFLFAILVSAAGIRTLAGLAQIDGPAGLPPGTQKDLAHILDILVTAGLITGGSDGLAQLLKIIKDGITKP